MSYLVSLLMGLAVGVAYGLTEIRSPAPPLIALLGLLGMVMGEQAVALAKACVAPPSQTAPDTGTADRPRPPS